jgi:hypothetical protein
VSIRLVVLLLAVLAGGCSNESTGPEEVALPAGVSVGVLQYRSDHTVRQIQITVTNAGTAPIRVAAARLDATGYSGQATWQSKNEADDATIGPGEAIDLPAPLRPVDCTPPASTPAPGPPGTARLDLREPDGTVKRTRPIPVTDTYGALAGVHDQDCRKTAALAIVDVRLLEPLTTIRKGDELTGYLDIKLTPTGKPGSVTIESIRSTTLLDPPRGDLWPIDKTVSASSGPQTVRLTLHPARCDLHAIAEDTLGTVMSVTMHVNDQPSGVVDFPSSATMRGEIQNYVIAACGKG